MENAENQRLCNCYVAQKFTNGQGLIIGLAARSMINLNLTTMDEEFIYCCLLSIIKSMTSKARNAIRIDDKNDEIGSRIIKDAVTWFNSRSEA